MMMTMDVTSLGALAVYLCALDDAEQAMKDACSTLQAATNMGCEPERLDYLSREICGAGSDCECAREELVDGVRAALYGPAKEPDPLPVTNLPVRPPTMRTMNLATLGALAVRLHQVDVAVQAIKYVSVLRVVAAAVDRECAQMDLVEVVRAALYGPAIEGDGFGPPIGEHALSRYS